MSQTGEEDEELMLELKCKLYRFDLDSNEWKERGVGPVKLLRHRESGKTLLLMRQEKARGGGGMGGRGGNSEEAPVPRTHVRRDCTPPVDRRRSRSEPTTS